MIFVSSLHKLRAADIPFVFTDRNAVYDTARISSDLIHLDRINWPDLQNRDFQLDPNRPDKKEKYMAEALVFQHLPLESLLGIVCFNAPVEERVKIELAGRGLNVNTATRPGWYF